MKSVQLTSLFFPAALMLALPAQAARPVIDSIIPDSSLTSITINGANLAGTPPRTVYLSGFSSPLTVTSASNTQIVAALPSGMSPGSYAVRVQGTGNGDFDEFFASFTAASVGGGAPCTSYSNASTSSGTFSAQLSVPQAGSYALSAKLVVNAIAPGLTSFSCSLAQQNGATFTTLDQTFTSMPGSPNVILQATATVSGPVRFLAGCSQVTQDGATPPTSYFNWKIRAVCLPALVSPSP